MLACCHETKQIEEICGNLSSLAEPQRGTGARPHYPSPKACAGPGASQYQ